MSPFALHAVSRVERSAIDPDPTQWSRCGSRNVLGPPQQIVASRRVVTSLVNSLVSPLLNGKYGAAALTDEDALRITSARALHLKHCASVG
uniref:Histidine ammonia-lyase n=1 Tax=Mesocestoides corti TaxID=53468 RepID=A0A5K3F1J4_MESCO